MLMLLMVMPVLTLYEKTSPSRLLPKFIVFFDFDCAANWGLAAYDRESSTVHGGEGQRTNEGPTLYKSLNLG